VIGRTRGVQEPPCSLMEGAPGRDIPV
jgi:hypothetical protein